MGRFSFSRQLQELFKPERAGWIRYDSNNEPAKIMIKYFIGFTMVVLQKCLNFAVVGFALIGHNTSYKMFRSVLDGGAGVSDIAGAAAIIIATFQPVQYDEGIEVPQNMYKQIRSTCYKSSTLLWGLIVILLFPTYWTFTRDPQAMCKRSVDITYSLFIVLSLSANPHGLAVLGTEFARERL